MSEEQTPRAVGTVVGVSSTVEFQMQVKPDSVRVQDLVAVDTWETDSSDGREPQRFRVWAKVGSIERLNPLFPREAAQELAFQGRDPVDSVVSLSREMITATCKVIGVQRDGRLEPPKYPVQPAGQVYVPPAAEVESFLAGDTPEHRRLYLGHERGNKDVRVFVDAHAVVSRHLAVLASTGAGKTVATRKLLEELMVKGYPILIFDPHGDYVGLEDLPGANVTTYLPQIKLATESPDRVISFVAGLSGERVEPAQADLLMGILEVLSDDSKHRQFNEALAELGVTPPTETLERNHFMAIAQVARILGALKGDDNRTGIPRQITRIAPSLGFQVAGTAFALVRKSGRAAREYAEMKRMNAEYSRAWQPLPSSAEMGGIVKDGHVTRVALQGYSDELRQSIVAGIMSQLLTARIDKKTPRFLTVIEEAHNFIPNRIDGIDAPSLPILKRIATEGRKYGMGLLFISQRPSRIDATVLSQANSYLIMRIVNPADQKYIRDVVETMGEDEARALPNLNTGEALLSGMFARIPVMVGVEKGKSTGEHEEEDFLAYLSEGAECQHEAAVPQAAETQASWTSGAALPPRHGLGWTDAEIQRLLHLFDSGTAFDSIAGELGRSRVSVIEKLRKNGRLVD